MCLLTATCFVILVVIIWQLFCNDKKERFTKKPAEQIEKDAEQGSILLYNSIYTAPPAENSIAKQQTAPQSLLSYKKMKELIPYITGDQYFHIADAWGKNQHKITREEIKNILKN